ILVDTGMPLEAPDMVVDENTQIFIGSRIKDYVSALKDLGYQPEQVTKILVTHKHEDHTGELRSFPQAKIYMSPEEADALNLHGDNIVRVAYKDGPYHTFDASEKIAEGVYLLPAKGHTTGNSIIVAECDGLFYMMHGDVTYTDEALYENKLSVVFEDKAAARDTLNRVREFIRKNPTVYCSTHTQLGYENLEAKKVCDLDNPPEPIPVDYEIAKNKATGKWICSICGYVYDPAEHDGVAFEDLPDDWKCPRCRQGKDKYNPA
ncbi:MAG: MBL fold metallo-hydrolase, partial [Acidaminococcaceae bacterium]|nr:MBL fold metallo-hydrolase [Acidaminococcaceae bacterium]